MAKDKQIRPTQDQPDLGVPYSYVVRVRWYQFWRWRQAWSDDYLASRVAEMVAAYHGCPQCRAFLKRVGVEAPEVEFKPDQPDQGKYPEAALLNENGEPLFPQ